MTPDQAIDLVSSGGVLGVLALIVWALYTEKVIPKGRLDAVCREKDERIVEAQKERDEARRQRDEALDGWRASTTAIEKLTQTLELRRAIRTEMQSEGQA